MNARVVSLRPEWITVDAGLVGKQVVVAQDLVGWDITPIESYRLTVERVDLVERDEVPLRAQAPVLAYDRVVRVSAHCPQARYTWTFFVGEDVACVRVV